MIVLRTEENWRRARTDSVRGGSAGILPVTLRAGFTMVELLVAVAILATLMTGVLLLFTGSMRAMKQGYQSMDAYAEARGALGVIERDLTTCFTSREYGDYYTFFGIPGGMTFVGVVKGPDSDDIGLARVTYVLHEHNPAIGLAGGLEFETTWWGEDPPGSGNWDWVPVNVQTRALLRYVEPSVGDLESFPYDWPAPDAASAPSETGSPAYNVWWALNGAVVWARGQADEVDLLNLDVNQFPALGSVVESAALGSELLKAKKRELWIRMLAGDPALPDIWGLLGRNRNDYVVAENILWHVQRLDNGQLLPVGDYTADVETLFFKYGRTAALAATGEFTNEFLPYFNSERNLGETWLTGWEAGDGYVSLTNGQLETFWQAEAYGNIVGDPLRPRLPELVGVDFRLMFASPYPGAPDFNRPFSATINIPSGLTRSSRGDLAAVP